MRSDKQRRNLGEQGWFRAKIVRLDERLREEGEPRSLSELVSQEVKTAPYPFGTDLRWDEWTNFPRVLNLVAELASMDGDDGAWNLWSRLVDLDLSVFATCSLAVEERNQIRVLAQRVCQIPDPVGDQLLAACAMAHDELFAMKIVHEGGLPFLVTEPDSQKPAQDRLIAMAELSAMAGEGTPATERLRAAMCIARAARELPGGNAYEEWCWLELSWVASIARILWWEPEGLDSAAIEEWLASSRPREALLIAWKGRRAELLESWRLAVAGQDPEDRIDQYWWREISLADRAIRSANISLCGEGGADEYLVEFCCDVEVEVAFARIRLRLAGAGCRSAVQLAESIEDPFAPGRRLRARHGDGALVVWSVGADGIDQGGLSGPSGQDRVMETSSAGQFH